MKESAVQMFEYGIPPTRISKELNVPISNVLEWLTEYNLKKKENKDIVKRYLRKNATDINTAEAKILVAASKVINNDITDDEWFTFQNSVNEELKILTLKIQGTIT